ncbi:hypothetical protein [Pseudanabaena sp. PCC 6802]|uniref:hypothetical protein n=1 Tax=Pseudanabaena sp. PCC 6802 TaxID=118173 RepID=UPI00034540A5|nr:hypothetical protein [Pseudanabaena sp. PCC 6802]
MLQAISTPNPVLHHLQNDPDEFTVDRFRERLQKVVEFKSQRNTQMLQSNSSNKSTFITLILPV